MKVLVIGSGGREHAIVWKLRQSRHVDKIYCAPGNGGTAHIAQNIDIKDHDIDQLLTFAKENEIDLTVVGPEVPLVMGIVDVFQEKGLKVFGPNKKCAQLEGSKNFTKEFLIRNNIPTAPYVEVRDIETAKEKLKGFGYPVVIKADGLAAGKGVVIAENEEQAHKALEDMIVSRKFGEAGDNVVIEGFLTGKEASILCFVDGKTMVPMESAQDYKKIFENDLGPNTGGMGSYSPNFLYDTTYKKEVEEKILKPMLEGFKKEEMDFKGILFIGLMLTEEGTQVLELNVRFGDPETQSILMRLETDLVEIMESICEGNLENMNIKWNDKQTVCVVISSGGYPESYEKNKVVEGLENVDDDVIVFHAGTKLEDERVLTNGGRVLGVTALGNTTEEARKKVYREIEKIRFDGMYYRKDIAQDSTY